MRSSMHLYKKSLLGSAAVAALALSATSAMAGGFEVRSQSTFFQGTAYAGAAAGGSSLSSVFWNPAASYMVGSGLTTDSNYTLIMPTVNVRADTLDRPGGGIFGDQADYVPASSIPGDDEVDIGRDALVPATYAAYRITDKLVMAASLNSQFGLTTKPDDMGWSGNYLSQTSKIKSYNFNPSLSYQITPQIALGVGLQVQHLEVVRLRTSLYNGNDADDVGVGYTAGVNITPFRGTSIGLGYRSQVTHDLEGDFVVPGSNPLITDGDLSLKLTTPDKVTLSLRQDVTPSARVFATVEWMDWSDLGEVPINIPLTPGFGGGQFLEGLGRLDVKLNANWEDTWMYALGGEYDVTSKLSVRAGAMYEQSPIQDPTSRLLAQPDADRIWASLGASYHWNEKIKINLAYSHVWVEDADIDRTSLLGQAGGGLRGRAEDNSADIVSVGLSIQSGGLSSLFGGE